jgi:glycosyltransferase XagB
MDDDHARKGTWEGLDLTSGAGGRMGSGRGNLDEASYHVLPLFPAPALDPLLRSLGPDDLDLCLRHKLLALPGHDRFPRYAAVTAVALATARQHGLWVVARIRPADFAAAVTAVLAPRLVDEAANGLARRFPQLSAQRRLTRAQKGALAVLLLLIAGGWQNHWNGYLLLAACVLFSFLLSMTTALRLFALFSPKGRWRLRGPPLPDAALPGYTVLVPLFRETRVLKQLLQGLRTLDYPASKLDIKLILEEHDAKMRAAVAALALETHFEVIVVPAGKPQTKPRALTYALRFSRGELLTIYDGEDIPEPRQLRQAASIFAAQGPRLACLQAALTFYNPNENWLTRQFNAEYAALFNVLLPFLAAAGLPLPLGGTSNHFRTGALLAVGAWDPYNVTEDADLGYRFAHLGFECGVLLGKTYEEANTQWPNWLRQRRRWLKGFLHTWLVLMRSPVRLFRALGLVRFLVVQCLSLGVYAAALLYPILFLQSLRLIILFVQDGQGLMLNLAMAVIIAVTALLGHSVAVLCAWTGLWRLGYHGWLFTLATLPIYWLMTTAAAWMALWDFLVQPHHWHKTEHGLSSLQQPGTAAPRRRRRRARFFSRAS